MKAKKVFENLDFKRGIEPKHSLELGMSVHDWMLDTKKQLKAAGFKKITVYEPPFNKESENMHWEQTYPKGDIGYVNIVYVHPVYLPNGIKWPNGRKFPPGWSVYTAGDDPLSGMKNKEFVNFESQEDMINWIKEKYK